MLPCTLCSSTHVPAVIQAPATHPSSLHMRRPDGCRGGGHTPQRRLPERCAAGAAAAAAAGTGGRAGPRQPGEEEGCPWLAGGHARSAPACGRLAGPLHAGCGGKVLGVDVCAGRPDALRCCPGLGRPLPSPRHAPPAPVIHAGLRKHESAAWTCSPACAGCCDPYNDKALRAGRGAVFKLPMRSGSWQVSSRRGPAVTTIICRLPTAAGLPCLCCQQVMTCCL